MAGKEVARRLDADIEPVEVVDAELLELDSTGTVGPTVHGQVGAVQQVIVRHVGTERISTRGRFALSVRRYRLIPTEMSNKSPAANIDSEVLEEEE